MSEMAPSHIRGKLGLVNYFMTGGGMLGGAIADGLFSIDSKHAYDFGWRCESTNYSCYIIYYHIVTYDYCVFRYMLGLAVVPALLMCCGLWFLFETPRWLVFHGKLEKAHNVMKKIRNEDAIEKEMQEIVKDYEFNSKNKLGKCHFIY